jgi:hypothetical protein
MTEGQFAAACPQCGSSAAVHSIEELVALTRGRLETQQQQAGQQGWRNQGQPGQGWDAEPQAGPVGGGGWQGGNWQGGGGWRGNARDMDFGGSIGDDVAGVAVAAAGKFIARAIGRRLERTLTEKVIPAQQARGEQALANQMAIAQKYPGLRACTTDNVIFLAGGTRTVPMSSVNLFTVTIEQADALVASLQG